MKQSEQIGYIRTNKEDTGEHFNKECHTLGNMTATEILKSKKSRPTIQKREKSSPN